MKVVQIGVVGTAAQEKKFLSLAEEVGRLIARRGWVLVCGGLSGVMEASAKGAKSEGGLTVGILPGPDAGSANPYIDIVLPTDMGHARNALIARSSDALVAVGGGYGTLSEIALAGKMGKKIVSLFSWEVGPEIDKAESPEEAIDIIEKSLGLP